MKPQKIQTIKELDPIYDKMQLQYGAKELHAITNGGCIDNPRVCFVFMNPTGRNVASLPDWKEIHSPWIGTKNVWKLFYRLGLMEERVYTIDNGKLEYEVIKRYKIVDVTGQTV